jgi:hypothetical protein
MDKSTNRPNVIALPVNSHTIGYSAVTTILLHRYCLAVRPYSSLGSTLQVEQQNLFTAILFSTEAVTGLER